MASAKEIQNRIRSIQDTMKITRAMYMMSSMKLRKAKQQLEDTEPYFFGLQEQISKYTLSLSGIWNIYTLNNRSKDQHEVVKKKAFIVLTGDKGMAGAYNHNVIKEAQRLCDESDEYKLYVVGDWEDSILQDRVILWMPISGIRQLIRQFIVRELYLNLLLSFIKKKYLMRYTLSIQKW